MIVPPHDQRLLKILFVHLVEQFLSSFSFCRLNRLMEEQSRPRDKTKGRVRDNPIPNTHERSSMPNGRANPNKPSRSQAYTEKSHDEDDREDESPTCPSAQPRVVTIDLSKPLGTMKMQQRRITLGTPALSQTVETTQQSEDTGPVAAMAKITRGSAWLAEPVTVGADPLPVRGRPGVAGDGTLRVLLVAEKPSVALALARAIGGDNDAHQRPGVTPVHVVRGRFYGPSGVLPCEYWVTSVRGHVTTVDYPEGLDDWAAVDPLALFAARVKRVVCSGAVAGHLAQCARECSVLVCATDADREGEHIAVEIASVAAPCLRPGMSPSVFRVRFSGLGAPELSTAMRSLGSPAKRST